MHRVFTKEQILTIPNLLSMVRLVLIPQIVWLYCVKGDHIAAVLVVALSGITDVADGFIARKWNQVSDFGKILDPVADKLTQAALIGCLLDRYSWMLPLLVLFVAKELIMAVSGLAVIRKSNVINSAQWFGKLSTVVLYVVMILLFLFPGVPETAANSMILLCAAVILLALVKYLLYYRTLLHTKKDAVTK